MSHRKLGEWVGPLYGAVLFAAYGLAVVFHAHPPFLGDFPNWVYQGDLLARHLRGLPDPSHQLKHYPVPNSTATVLLSLLSYVLSWSWAAKLFVCFQLCLAWFGIRRLSTAAKSSRLVWLIAPGAFFLNIDFWYGLISFQLGLGLLFLFLAHYLREAVEADRFSFTRALLLILLFFTHMVPFTFACLVLGCDAYLRRSIRGLLTAVPGLLLSLWYVAGRFLNGNPDTETAISPGFTGVAQFLLFKVNTALKSFGYVNPGSVSDHSAALALLGTALFILVLLVAMFVAVAIASAEVSQIADWWSDLRRADSPSTVRSAVHLAVLLTLPVYLVMPRAMLGISDPGARVLQIAMYVGLFLLAGHVALLRIAAAGSIVLACTGFWLFLQLGFSGPHRLQEKEALPVALERFALVPYAQTAGSYELLRQRNTEQVVFPTGLFVNTPRR